MQDDHLAQHMGDIAKLSFDLYSQSGLPFDTIKAAFVTLISSPCHMPMSQAAHAVSTLVRACAANSERGANSTAFELALHAIVEANTGKHAKPWEMDDWQAQPSPVEGHASLELLAHISVSDEYYISEPLAIVRSMTFRQRKRFFAELREIVAANGGHYIDWPDMLLVMTRDEMIEAIERVQE